MNVDQLNPYGYPCGAHTHATPQARQDCRGASKRDNPIDGCHGWVTGMRAA